MLSEFKDIHQVYYWLTKENNIKELGQNNSANNSVKMFSSKELRYDISSVEAILTWIKSLQNCRHTVGNDLKIKVHHDRKKKDS